MVLTHRILSGLILFFASACMAIGCSTAKPNLNNQNPPTTSDQPAAGPVIDIFVEGGFLNDLQSPTLIFAAWEDGKVIWSADQIRGGPPLFTANLSKQQRDLLFTRLDEIAAKAGALPRRGSFGPDAKITRIRYRKKPNDLWLASWHEISETNPNLVASSLGIEALHGRKREDVLAASTQEYRQFRAVWKEIRETIASALPTSGEEIEPYKAIIETR